MHFINRSHHRPHRVEPKTGIEPVTSSLPRKCSTPELLGPVHTAFRMERVTGIEPVLPAWKAGVLPLNYTRVSSRPGLAKLSPDSPHGPQARWHKNPIWWRGMDSNHRRLSQQIYSLPPLTAREPLLNLRSGFGRRAIVLKCRPLSTAFRHPSHQSGQLSPKGSPNRSPNGAGDPI